MPTAAAVPSEALIDVLVLVDAGAEDLRPVAAEQEDRHDPADDHDRAGDGERVTDVVGAELGERERLATEDRGEDAEGDEDQIDAERHRRDVAQVHRALER